MFKVELYANGVTCFEGFTVYRDGEILWSSARGSIDKADGTTSHHVRAFNLSEEPKRALKENLNRKDNYYIKKKLYIHADEINVEFLGEQVRYKTEEKIDYIDFYKLTFKHGYEYRGFKATPVEPDYKPTPEEMRNAFQNKKTGQWCIRSYPLETGAEITITSDYITRTEITEHGEKLKAIADVMNKCVSGTYTISSYNVEKMLKVLDIKIKAEQ